MFVNVPESITHFFDLRSSSFATRHSLNRFGSALAAPSGGLWPSSFATQHSLNKFDSALAAPLGDFKAFARELFMSDYDMGDGGHVFRPVELRIERCPDFNRWSSDRKVMLV